MYVLDQCSASYSMRYTVHKTRDIWFWFSLVLLSGTLIRYSYPELLSGTCIRYSYPVHVSGTLIRYMYPVLLAGTLSRYSYPVLLSGTLIRYSYPVLLSGTLIRCHAQRYLINTWYRAPSSVSRRVTCV